jgi:hypothetical protein
MKMLFFSSDTSEVQRLKEQFDAVGVACEIRDQSNPDTSTYVELWIRNDKDCHRAFLLCAQLGLGFATRAARARPEIFEPAVE